MSGAPVLPSEQIIVQIFQRVPDFSILFLINQLSKYIASASVTLQAGSYDSSTSLASFRFLWALKYCSNMILEYSSTILFDLLFYELELLSVFISCELKVQHFLIISLLIRNLY